MLAAGLSYEIAVLDIRDSADGLNEAERWWIAYGRASGWDLTNHTDGGEGTRGLVFTKDHRAKLSAAHKGRKLTVEHREAIGKGHIGRPTTARMRQRTAEANRSRAWSDEAREKLRTFHLGRSPSASARAKQRKKMLGWKFGPPSPEKRAKLSAALKGRPLSWVTKTRMKIRRRPPPRLRVNLLTALKG